MRTNQQVVSGVEVQNPGGTRGSALIVYRRGITAFQERVCRGFAAGLVAGGWRVELITADDRAPLELSRYDLLAVGAPTYWGAPARALQRYLARLEDLCGKPAVVLITGALSTSRAQRITEELLRGRHANIVASRALHTMAPNRTADVSWRTNKAVGIAIAESIGRAIAPPRL